MAGESRVKGQSFRGIAGAIERLFGAEAIRAVEDAMVGEAGQAMRYQAIVASGWYPVAWYRELHRAAAQALPREPDLARRLGEAAARDDLRGVYSFILRLAGPVRSFQHAGRVLSTYWEGARVDVLDEGPTHVTLRFHGMRGLDDRVWEDALGGTRVIAELTVASNATLRRLEGGREGDDSVVFELRWG